jgi:hypothetical protein
VQSSQSDGVQGFLTILGNILTVWELARGKEWDVWTHSRSEGLLEGLRWGNSTVAKFAKVLQQK